MLRIITGTFESLEIVARRDVLCMEEIPAERGKNNELFSAVMEIIH